MRANAAAVGYFPFARKARSYNGSHIAGARITGEFPLPNARHASCPGTSNNSTA